MAEAPATHGWVTRRAAYAGVGALGLLGLSTAGAAAAGLDALVRARPRPLIPPASVMAVGPARSAGCTTSVCLRGPGADDPGWVALVTPRGRLLAGPPTPCVDGWERQCSDVPGTPAPVLGVGSEVEVRADAWEGCDDPFRLGATTAHLESEHGALAVTTVGPDEATDAVVYLHGRGGNRATGWWLAPTCVDAGWRTVMPAYRNGSDGPRTGRYLLGGEWVDLSVVLDRLAHDGVRRVVLVGWSMGGNICASYLRQREATPERFTHHPTVAGLVLDAAALDWGHVLRHVARNRRLPGALVPLVMAFGQHVRRIDWRDLDHVADADHLDVPVLAFHGDEDDIVPAELTSMLGASLPHVRVERFAGAGHCRSVNVDPWRYLTLLRSFLDTVRVAADAPRVL